MKHIRIITLTLCAIFLGFTQQSPARQRIEAKPVVSILGDSYSTFKGYVPEGNRVWYSTTPKAEKTDVDDVRQTWWWQVVNEGGFILGVNESYSGATVCNSGYNGDDYSDRSFVTRLPRLGSPDVILIFGATNDSWAKAPLGEFVYDKQQRGHFYEFRPAFAYLVDQAIKRYPGTEVYVIVNDVLDKEVESSIKTICGHYNVPYIMLHGIDKKAGHPTRLGMTQIKEQVLEVLRGK